MSRTEKIECDGCGTELKNGSCRYEPFIVKTLKTDRIWNELGYDPEEEVYNLDFCKTCAGEFVNTIRTIDKRLKGKEQPSACCKPNRPNSNPGNEHLHNSTY